MTAILLVLMGVVTHLAVGHLLQWRARRGEALDLWVAGWSASACLFLLSHLVQLATPHTALGGRLTWSSGLLLVILMLGLVHALAHRLETRVGKSLTPIVAWPIGRIVEYLDDLRKEDLDPGKALAKAKCPILLMAGDAEDILKIVEIEYLYGCIPEPKRLVLFEGAGHEDLLLYDTKQYARAAGAFIRDYAPCAQPSPTPVNA